MDALLDGLVVVAMIANGLLAGLFFVFANAICPGFRAVDDSTYVRAFRAINSTILNGWFLSVFFVAPLSAVAAAALRWWSRSGVLFCGSCGSRMQLDFPANRQGVRYAYYVCSGRASKRKKCTRRAVPVGIAEQLVADCYRDIAITEARYAVLAAQVEAAFDERLASRSDELAELTANRQRLQKESDKILAAHFADAIDLETLKRHQDRIRTGLADIDRKLATEHDHHEGSRKQLTTALSLLVDCANLYARTNDQGKRLANQALTNGIDISEDERATIRLAEPFAALVPEPTSTDVSGSSTSDLVDSIDHYGNRRQRVEQLVTAWNQRSGGWGEPDGEPDDALIDAAAEPTRRPRTRLTDEEVDAMRTAREQGVSVTALVRQFGVHRGTVWARTRR